MKGRNSVKAGPSRKVLFDVAERPMIYGSTNAEKSDATGVGFPGPIPAVRSAHAVPATFSGSKAVVPVASAPVMGFVAPFVNEMFESVCEGPSTYPEKFPELMC